ncbi:type II toxin-antitoxin system RelE/ParE family toxin [Rhizobium herbae]|uniref:Plasmid stabilization system protein ParE n=1 Tax=Rhizobium herbae TaxID=508661 RepID=A0ABS4ENJ4_9HYPH|nr:type II toxin-antitoxin system RelE/ParE family toxin [Rhizobium herbae]MBP1859488.1 plasmid stabilization system protein ParE [Rhizobium herbae]
MAYKVIRHPLVKNDLLKVTIFIGDYAGYDVAEEKVEEIERSLFSLTDFPHIGTIRGEIYPRLRVIPASSKAVICFTVDDERKAVDVICITYGGANWMARVKERQE